MKTRKSEETRTRILDAALNIFRERGFERATMREIAAAAGVAAGAAYYYFESKEAIVMAFYERSQAEMLSLIAEQMGKNKLLEPLLRAIISTKFEVFAPNRKLLGALSAHADPEHPLSPFSKETAAIREQDIAFFEKAVTQAGIKLPSNLTPYLPRLLWMYQMGLILFWVYDRSAGQRRTMVLYDKTLKMVMTGIKLAGNPFLRPLHKLAAELLEVIYGDEAALDRQSKS
ncbi:MAG: TetR family transcriptional regulator [Edaphobacter sp.]|uniref:TetR/AcrR family transcriptional regulator n=1 Tax=Edaphobacter sp. TaxID=1934404 RepID=UPI00238EA8A5|nr:TetR family transcriptional regulator [Edaphobacter sp.]MDE1178626.1 TetR family transcriptional regulator [Edaphobacter sp.]